MEERVVVEEQVGVRVRVVAAEGGGGARGEGRGARAWLKKMTSSLDSPKFLCLSKKACVSGAVCTEHMITKGSRTVPSSTPASLAASFLSAMIRSQ